jgi:sugar/nucleoside kinase (ribokinase family)
MLKSPTNVFGALFLLWSILSSVESLSSSSSTSTPSPLRIIVVGKIIIDEYYGNPEDPEPRAISIGGGGPQAAFGAALALAAVWSSDADDNMDKPQPVTFVGPVGDDWTELDTQALDQLLGAAVESIVLLKGQEGLKTPRIQLWHDAQQQIQWKALYDSFGPKGADGLWADRPSATDFLNILGNNDKSSVVCHVICEGGANAAGRGQDIRFLQDVQVQNRLAFLGIEPVAFPDETAGTVSPQDAESILSRLASLSPAANLQILISPDLETYQAVVDAAPPAFWNQYQVAIRKGPRGSIVLPQGGDSKQQTVIIPPATLMTSDGTPVNPTGAGNAYSGAMTALRSMKNGVISLEEAACIASAVGAVFCEYEHIPPWTPEVLARVRTAAEQVRAKVAKGNHL